MKPLFDKWQKYLEEGHTDLLLSEVTQGMLKTITYETEIYQGQPWPDYVIKDWLWGRDGGDFKNAPMLANLVKPWGKGTQAKKEAQKLPEVLKSLIFWLKERVGEFLGAFMNEFPNRRWKLEQIEVTMEIFNDLDKSRLVERSPKNGTMPDQSYCPKDLKRHIIQRELIKKRGITKEPIILIERDDGKYKLLEGWHRTIQGLTVHSKGYIQNAWIYKRNEAPI